MIKNNNYVCMAKEGVNFRKYNFEYDNTKQEYVFKINTRRITVTKNRILKFNQVTVEVLRVFADLVRDDVIYFVYNENARKRTLMISEKEYKVIMEMRKNAEEEQK